jgi:hypothetical protein
MITLPEYPAPQGADAALVDYGALLEPSLGGPVQRIERMGNRWRLSVTMPPLLTDALKRHWLSALVRGKQEGAKMEFPLMGFAPGSTGSPTVNGGSQSGRSLLIENALPNLVVRDGQFFSIETDGQHYLYMNIGQTILNASGAGTLTIEPMLRVPPADGDDIHLAKPMIEGFIKGDEQVWNISLGNIVSLAFDLVESE